MDARLASLDAALNRAYDFYNKNRVTKLNSTAIEAAGVKRHRDAETKEPRKSSIFERLLSDPTNTGV